MTPKCFIEDKVRHSLCILSTKIFGTMRDERCYLRRNLIIYTGFGDIPLRRPRAGFDKNIMDHKSLVFRI
jgi:hypothetical protein